ncbi:MAG: hypothetical protein HFF90_07600 [Oscillibacter sp.]|nr:hypothetical protein [Oscillibacter sp.]
MEAIQAVYPKSCLRRCIVHQIRSSTRFVRWKDIKLVPMGLKRIYTSVTMNEAEENLFQFAEKWRKQYPSCMKSWEEHWGGDNVLRMSARDPESHIHNEYH